MTLRTVALAGLLALGLVGCASTTEKSTSGSDTDLGATATPGTGVDDTTGTPIDGSAMSGDCPAPCEFIRDSINDPNSLLAQKIVYFDFDQSTVRPEFMEVVAAHGRYLAAFADVKVRLEGHADERGSREYNIALGERRALAVRRQLLLQGAREEQLTNLSYGEEMPAALGHGEEVWAKNRRVEFVYDAR